MRRRRPQTELAPELEPTVPGPEVDAEQRSRLEQLVDDLQSLPERQRGALVMRELNGLSYDDIGSALGLTNEAARRAVFDARNALHAAADGRATECVSVRHSISDGDRRSLRARSIRAHLRSCDDCASFQRSIGARRADLHLLAPWMSGAAVVGALGLGAGGAGGGAVLASSGAAAGGGGIWASLPLAAKGLAVAAAVATTGTAAVEIKHAAQPVKPATHSQAAQVRSAHASASARALRAAALAASAAAARSRTTSTAHANRVRTSSGTTTSSAGSRATTKVHRDTPALQPPAPITQADPAPAAATPPPAAPPPPPPATAEVVPQTPADQAIAKLGRLGDQVKQVLAQATAVASDGTQEALALATGLLDRTLGPLTTSINRVLASLGLAPLKAPSTASAAPAATQPAAPSLLAPVQQVLSGVQSLLAKLLGHG